MKEQGVQLLQSPGPSNRKPQPDKTSTPEPAQLIMPQSTDQKNNAILQSSLRELKENYYQIEGQIASETQKQRASQKERYSMVLDKIQSLKKLLKIEVDQRKNAELHFREEISSQSNTILEKFSAEYLNRLREMQEQVDGFS